MLGPFNDSTNTLKHIKSYSIFVNRVDPCQSISTTLKTKQNMTNWTSLLTAVGRLTFHLGHGCLSRQHVGMIGLWSTLRYSNITMENPPFVNEFPIGNGGISIATKLDYWSVILFELCCYKVLGRSWFSSLRSTHTHTQRHKHITGTMAISFTFRDQRFRFSDVFWYHPVKASSWPKGALPTSRENCRPFFPLSLLRIRALFL